MPVTAEVVERLIARKGSHRAPQYLAMEHTRPERFLAPLFHYLSGRRLRVLEIGGSFGHMTAWLARQPNVEHLTTCDSDAAWAEILRLRDDADEVRCVSPARELPWADATFDLVIACGVVEHIRAPWRRQQVDEWYRVLALGGHCAILDTPNRWFPWETHSVGLPLVQWLPARAAYPYARRTSAYREVSFLEFEGGAWRNATRRDCLPSHDVAVRDVTRGAGYGRRFFITHARRKWLARLAVPTPYLNLVFERVA